MKATVKWKGLTEFTAPLKSGRRRISSSANRMTKRLKNRMRKEYVANLSGAVPSSDESPLPVGVQSGELLQGAREGSRQLNSWAFEQANSAPHAGHIEFGTSKMLPRRPLADAVDKVGETVPGEMAQVLGEVFD